MKIGHARQYSTLRCVDGACRVYILLAGVGQNVCQCAVLVPAQQHIGLPLAVQIGPRGPECFILPGMLMVIPYAGRG